MAPKEIENQTISIVKCLFEDFSEIHEKGQIESDFPGEDEEDDNFDPVIIADKLRELGDDYDERVIQPLIQQLRQAPSDQVDRVFDECVDRLCQTWNSGEVVPEMYLLKATVTLGLSVKKMMPDLMAVVQDTMIAFLNRRLVPWVNQRGGWDEVASI